MLFTIGDVAKQAGVGVQTVRFYEREGLIEEPPRASSGYRSYNDDVITRLRFIKRAQELGFTLREVRELIALQTDTSAECGALRVVAQTKLADIEQRIADLRRMESALQELVDSCSGGGPMASCRIVECLTTC